MRCCSELACSADPRPPMRGRPRATSHHRLRSSRRPIVARVENYSPGRVVVDGVELNRDVIVLPNRVLRSWWRREGHSLVIEDLEDVLDELPERLIVGCGYSSRLEPDPSVIAALQKRGVKVEALPTEDAVARFEELETRNPAAVAAALHLTC
ncbi:MAG: hypothetical protein E6G48_00575 [Actinobacteria bacterium]|nr:MAG: hypothetical protein E6G48_00575 [Actinomycetota bacterium]